MNDYSNIFLAVIFTGMAVWMFIGVSKTRNLIFKDKMWTVPRILFLVAGVLCVVSAFVYSSVLEWLRLLAMVLCVIGFLLLRDGIRDDGFAVMGRFYPFSSVRAYDYGDYKKGFRVYFVNEGEDNDSAIACNLQQEDKQEIIKFLKAKIGKKYTRMKKG